MSVAHTVDIESRLVVFMVSTPFALSGWRLSRVSIVITFDSKG